MTTRTLIGLESLREQSQQSKTWGRCGLVCNQASVSWDWQHAVDICRTALEGRLRAVFGPQHGFLGAAQDNMIETAHGSHPELALQVYSLYSETRAPTAVMLEGLDTLVIDLQLVGCRVYTFKATIAGCLKAAKKYGKKVVILDRPNPLGGVGLEGRCLDPGMSSFVGPYSIPMRHGLTPGEAGLFFNSFIGADLEVVPLQGWDASKDWRFTARPWVLTSPNLPTLDPVFVYPGTVLFEGCNVSEGRGTGLPFQYFGAPFGAFGGKLKKRFYDYLPKAEGVYLREAAFEPTSGKWMGKTCLGVQIHILEPEKIKSFHLALALVKSFWDLGGDSFAFKAPPYEYEYEKLPMKLILGSEQCVDKLKNYHRNDDFWQEGIEAYMEQVKPFLLYERKMQILSFD